MNHKTNKVGKVWSTIFWVNGSSELGSSTKRTIHIVAHVFNTSKYTNINWYFTSSNQKAQCLMINLHHCKLCLLYLGYQCHTQSYLVETITRKKHGSVCGMPLPTAEQRILVSHPP